MSPFLIAWIVAGVICALFILKVWWVCEYTDTSFWVSADFAALAAAAVMLYLLRETAIENADTLTKHASEMLYFALCIGIPFHARWQRRNCDDPKNNPSVSKKADGTIVIKRR